MRKIYTILSSAVKPGVGTVRARVPDERLRKAPELRRS
jgi:hypothetical protein